MSETSFFEVLWRRIESKFIHAWNELGEPDRLRLYVNPFSDSPKKWYVKRDNKILDDLPTSMMNAGEALVDLSYKLPLFNDPETGVSEALLLDSSYGGQVIIEVFSFEPEAAIVKLLTSVEDIIAFSQSRCFDAEDTSDWAMAAQRRSLRKTVFGGYDVLEPGVVWFVEWLEARGAETIFSCEGHPHGFYVDFRGPYQLAHALAGLPNVWVRIFRSGSYPQPNQWKLELSYEPEDRAARDEALRALSKEMSNLMIMIGDHRPD